MKPCYKVIWVIWVLAMALCLCLSVCLSVTSRYCVETAGRIELCYKVIWVLAVALCLFVCLSVCLSQAGIVLKRLNESSSVRKLFGLFGY